MLNFVEVANIYSGLKCSHKTKQGGFPSSDLKLPMHILIFWIKKVPWKDLEIFARPVADTWSRIYMTSLHTRQCSIRGSVIWRIVLPQRILSSRSTDLRSSHVLCNLHPLSPSSSQIYTLLPAYLHQPFPCFIHECMLLTNSAKTNTCLVYI